MKPIIGANPPDALGGPKTLRVEDDDAGQRLDNFLMRHLKGVPKTHVYRIIRSGEVRVNKGRASADTRVEAGDLVRVPPVRVSEATEAKAEKAELPKGAKAPLKDGGAPKGYTVKEAAKFMGVADDTVSAHMVRAHKKTGLTTMEIVVLMARQVPQG